LLPVIIGVPLSYNRDLQEDKEALFDASDTLLASLEVFSGMVATLKYKKENMQRSLASGYILATDVADYLVKKGLNIRAAHGITGRQVNYAVEFGKTLEKLTLDEYLKFSSLFTEDIYAISADGSAESKNVPGGTAPGQVVIQLARCRRILDAR